MAGDAERSERRAAATRCARRLVLLGATAILALAPGVGIAAETPDGRLTLSSDRFATGASIPAEYTCEGRDASPPLRFAGVPPSATALALVCDDPDAPGGTWVHWVVYDLPPGTAQLAEGQAKSETLTGGAQQGRNDFRHIGYNGPCPPPGKAHRYFFRLFALDGPTGLAPGATEAELLAAIRGHTVAQAVLEGRFAR